MSRRYAYEAPAAAENFVRADFLGWDRVNDVVRRIQPGDQFAGFVIESEDRTGLNIGTNTHASPGNGTIAVGIGLVEVQFTNPLETVHIGRSVYADSPVGITHDLAAGPYVGRLIKPWLEHPGYYEVDTKPAYMNEPSETLEFSDISIVVEPAAGGVQRVATQALDASGQDYAGSPLVFQWFLSDLPSGAHFSPTSANGGVAVATRGDVQELLTGLQGLAITDVNVLGFVNLDIAHSIAAESFYFVVVLPDGELRVSSIVTPTP